MSIFGDNTHSIFDDNIHWEIRLLGAIIRMNINDYNDPKSPWYKHAKKWLFGNAGKVDSEGRPKNKLEFWLSYTDIDPDAIRRHLKKPDDFKK